MRATVSENGLMNRMRNLVGEFDGQLSGEAGERFAQIVGRLDEPLRIAVAGQVKAGKSTLVNALLHQIVAPTDVSECTKVVTWFRRGQPERVEIRLRDQRSLAAQLESDGTLPRELPVPVTEVDSLQVYLDNDELQRMTVIDTPGLGSLNEEFSASAAELLAMERGSHEAAGAADALVLVLNQTVKEQDVMMLEGWAEAGRASDLPRAFHTNGSAVNAIGVLSKADKLGDGRGGISGTATELAARQAEQIKDQVATVVPLVGLLAETVYAANLTEPDAASLEALADLDLGARTMMLLSPDLFLGMDTDVPLDARRRLLKRLDLFGLRCALDCVERGITGASALGAELARASGIEQVEQALRESFLERRDALLVRSTLDALEGLTFMSDPGARAALLELRARIETIRPEPAMHELAELDALRVSLAGEVELPVALRQDLERLARSRRPAERLGARAEEVEALREAALAGNKRWRSFKLGGADPDQAKIADVMIRSYTLAYSAYRR